MKQIVFALIAIINTSPSMCTHTNAAAHKTSVETGIVKGRVTDAQGNPMPNAKVVVESTIFYASYVHATTNATGDYRVAVPKGSWKTSVRIEKSFLGRPYRFDLHPDNAEPFAGKDGAVRNFTWKLSGEKPDGTGFYGSTVAVYSQPGSSFMMDEVELTLTPEGALIDGNKGKTITAGLTDIGGGEDGIRDVPLGKYNITARNKTTGKPLQVRLRNKGEYATAVTGIFLPGFTGITNYQIVVQVQ
jgi:hypothetical protein